MILQETATPRLVRDVHQTGHSSAFVVLVAHAAVATCRTVGVLLAAVNIAKVVALVAHAVTACQAVGVCRRDRDSSEDGDNGDPDQGMETHDFGESLWG